MPVSIDVVLSLVPSDLGSNKLFNNGTSNSFRNVASPFFSTGNNTVSNDAFLERIFQYMSNTSFTGITVSNDFK